MPKLDRRNLLLMQVSILLLIGSSRLDAVAGGSPIRCDSATGECMVFNTYGSWPDRTYCKVGEVLAPTTEAQLVAAVAYGVQNNLSMKVVSRLAHSIPKLVCPRGDNGLLISTANYSSNIDVHFDSKAVTVDSGVELQQLLQTLGNAGLSLPASPYWNGVSIGGLLCTGSHGSSLWGKGSAVHDYVTGMRIIVPASPQEGYAKVITLSEADEDLNAAKVSLGVLGVISRVTLSLQPLFKRSVTNLNVQDLDLKLRIQDLWKKHEFADVSWYPSKYQAILRLDDRVSVASAGDSVNAFIGFQPTLATIVETQRSLENTFEVAGNALGKCETGVLQNTALFAAGFGFKSSLGVFTGYPVVGFQHKMQASGGCQNSPSKLFVCPWDPSIRGLFYHQTTVSIALNKITDFIRDVEMLRNLDSSSLCGVDLYNGLLMRYVKVSSAYLGKQEDSVDVDITYYRSRDGNTPRLNEDVLEEIEQIALFKYDGLPHWGKNRNLAYRDMRRKYPKLPKFLEVKSRFDPNGLFSSEWSDALLLQNLDGRSRTESLTRHCALEGLCVCSLDIHCAPEKRYFCRPGLVYAEARVCRYLP